MNPDYRDMLSAFAEENVKFLLLGAYALAAHGHVRATGDMDLWVESSPDNATRIMAALRRFGAPLHQIEEQDFRDPRHSFPDRRRASQDRYTDRYRHGRFRASMGSSNRGGSRRVEDARDQPPAPTTK